MNEGAVPADPVGQIRGQEQQDRRDGNLGPMPLLCDGTIEVPHLGWHGEREKDQKRDGPGHAEHPHRLEELLFQGLLCVGVHAAASLRMRSSAQSRAPPKCRTLAQPHGPRKPRGGSRRADQPDEPAHRSACSGWCGRGNSNPHRPCGPTDFLTSYGFRRLARPAPMRRVRVCGLDYPFTVLRPSRRLGAARLVSTPSRPGLRPVRAWLGIASQGFPEFGQFCIRGFPRSTQVCLKSVASTGFATPA